MAKRRDITNKLSFDGNPCLVIKGKDIEVNADAPTVLKVMGIFTSEDTNADDIVAIYDLIFPEKSKKKLEEKKEQNQRLLRELSLKYASVDRLVDKQNQALCTVLKCQGGAVLNAELVQNLIGKVYVYPGKRIEVLWKWKDIWME